MHSGVRVGVPRASAHISRLALHRRTLAQDESEVHPISAAAGPSLELGSYPRAQPPPKPPKSNSPGIDSIVLLKTTRSTTETPTSLRSLSTSTDEPSQPLIVLVLAKDVLVRVHLEIQKSICFSSSFTADRRHHSVTRRSACLSL